MSTASWHRHTGKPQTHQYPNTHVSKHRNSWSIMCFATWQASVGIIIPSNPSILIFKYPNILVSSYLDIKLPKCLPCNHSDILALWKVYNVHWTFGWKSHLTRCRLPSVHFLIRDSHSKAGPFDSLVRFKQDMPILANPPVHLEDKCWQPERLQANLGEAGEIC